MAFQRLYARYNVNVFNTALGYMKNVELAEEVTQDVFLAIFQKADTFKGTSKVSTWVYRIVVNKSLNYLDKQSRRPTSDEAIDAHHKIDFNHPGVQLKNQEASRHLFAAMDILPPTQKTAFILSYVEGLPQSEVADVMQKSLKSVESLLQRAKGNLRIKLNSFYSEGKC